MKFKDIPAHLGISQSHLAELCCVKPQSLTPYSEGRRRKSSSLIDNVCAVANVIREEIFFPDVFDHPHGENPNRPEYWANIAIEALKQADILGADTDAIKESIFWHFSEKLPDVQKY